MDHGEDCFSELEHVPERVPVTSRFLLDFVELISVEVIVLPMEFQHLLLQFWLILVTQLTGSRGEHAFNHVSVITEVTGVVARINGKVALVNCVLALVSCRAALVNCVLALVSCKVALVTGVLALVTGALTPEKGEVALVTVVVSVAGSCSLKTYGDVLQVD
ncbi:hypothetical protein JNUCC1_00809 [Lentibacillus sp. JNUCC-1]|nr:hypothetical protein [Lentibacillus sp. JNUCC-1]